MCISVPHSIHVRLTIPRPLFARTWSMVLGVPLDIHVPPFPFGRSDHPAHSKDSMWCPSNVMFTPHPYETGGFPKGLCTFQGYRLEGRAFTWTPAATVQSEPMVCYPISCPHQRVRYYPLVVLRGPGVQSPCPSRSLFPHRTHQCCSAFLAVGSLVQQFPP